MESSNPESPVAAVPLARRVRVVLVGAQHPGNIGAAARAMKTMGLRELVLVAPRRFPDPQAAAMASGAEDLLERARVCATLDEALAGCTHVAATTARQRYLSLPLFTPREWVARHASGAVGGHIALMFGRERVGLTNEEVDRCQELISIPADPEYSSLNLSQAVQVLAYEIRASQPAGLVVEAHEPVDAAEMERFYQHLEQTLVDLRFLNPDNPRLLMRRLRRLFARAAPDANEMNILRGMLTHAQQAVTRSGGAWSAPADA
jgi:RNA methyltransferase, TrmH family, group 1